ncbi:TatD family nuclease-associated radical SAM protein [Thomasclavelia cocleata]|uniref:7-carboxy-7-deazaguanine synthase n=2 Tax=Thomasclavelia cocleata TaxID=69824 RepID=A0A1I0EGE6_9FIRM|nr:TatD family nuclease-associated radical SAM protein [Thomasclavelia cocleata]MCI9630749.1 radical SAM protein [Thomasclavelia cocleata]MCR1959353.1 TatD family nuclease-associated radical SAM protein [Thomasclavelia cocleata]NDO42380.1 radical SAM protein [Thomasclavelia cocleata]PJN81022.1 radical SAM protein [Thomasclavelia cocleata]SET44127.1 radical SAM protein, TatD family-associated [Thomasclavelia cocleata]
MVILYTVFKNSYIDIKELDELKGVTCYVNSTNRCSCACTFCLRNTKEMLESNSLWLKEEPTVEMIIEEFKKYDLNDFKEVVFCGFGEPLTRHDDLMKVAKYLKETRNDLLIRINTNGLSSVTLKRDITPDFKGLIDTVSISLNAPDKEEYYQLTRARYGIDSFDHMLDFAKKAKQYVKNVILTVVDIIGEEKIIKCQNIADELGVTLRVRPFEE